MFAPKAPISHEKKLKKKEGTLDKRKKSIDTVKMASVSTSTEIDQHPFAVGSYLVLEWLDKSPRLAQVLERSCSNPDAKCSAEQWSYYCHFLDFNRRMDEWISHNRILEPPSLAAVQAKEHASNSSKSHATTSEAESSQAASRGRSQDLHSQRKKRKNDEGDFTVIAADEHDEHEGIDEASLKEHEEVTKVKVIP